ncbi:hypothetical protein OKW30_006053 [Paraburkholderia sp. Clong3]
MNASHPVNVSAKEGGSSQANGIDVPTWKIRSFQANRRIRREAYASWD